MLQRTLPSLLAMALWTTALPPAMAQAKPNKPAPKPAAASSTAAIESEWSTRTMR